jgi:hypothetical protein
VQNNGGGGRSQEAMTQCACVFVDKVPDVAAVDAVMEGRKHSHTKGVESRETVV